MSNRFNTNQIVKGINAGYFVILGTRNIAGEKMYECKEVNPANFTQTAPGLICLPEDALTEAV